MFISIQDLFMAHINNYVSYTDGQILESIAVFAACPNICLDICHWLLLCSSGRGVEGEQDLISCSQKLKLNIWLCTFLKPCSEPAFGLGGCTGAAVPVFCTVASIFFCICCSLQWICPWMQSRCLLMVTFSHSCPFLPAAA